MFLRHFILNDFWTYRSIDRKVTQVKNFRDNEKKLILKCS